MTLGHLTAFAWNRGSEAWMFATGTHEGEVHIWTIGALEDAAQQNAFAAPRSASIRSSGSVFSDAQASKRGSSGQSFGDFTQSPVVEAHYPLFTRQGTADSSGSDRTTVRDEDGDGDNDDDD